MVFSTLIHEHNRDKNPKLGKSTDANLHFGHHVIDVDL